MNKHLIVLPGVPNPRDLGGFPVGAKHVKKDILIRSGALNEAKPQALDLLREKYHLRAIVDFRMGGERMKAPDPEISGVKMIGIPVVEMEDYIVKLGNPDLAKQYLTQSFDRETMIEIAYKNGLIGPELYVLFLLEDRGIKAYKEFFQVLLKADPQKGAILWHCTDGKDRAGLASALLLAALGASRETICEDYLLTNEANALAIERAKEKYSSREIAPEMLEVLMFSAGGAIERYLNHAFEALEQRYGGIDGYLTDALGLSREDRDVLVEKYTC